MENQVKPPESSTTSARGDLYPRGATEVAIVQGFFTFALVVLAAIFLRQAAASEEDFWAAVGLAVVVLCFATVSGVCVYGLWHLRPYGRRLQIIFSVLGLIVFPVAAFAPVLRLIVSPVGTLVSALVLFYLSRPGVKLAYSGLRAEELKDSERQAIAEVTSGPLFLAVFLTGAFVLLFTLAAVLHTIEAMHGARDRGHGRTAALAESTGAPRRPHDLLSETGTARWHA